MAKENTKETRLEAKKSRYSAVSIIMREMYGTKFGYMPGYILLQDVFYKHFKEKEMPVEELIKWLFQNLSWIWIMMKLWKRLC